MPRTPILAGIAAGALLGLGGIVAADYATEGADAKSGSQHLSQSIQPQLTSANLRSQRGIKQATTVWNQLGIYLAPEGTQIEAKGPRVSQQEAVGGGLPEEAFSAEVRAKLNNPLDMIRITKESASLVIQPGDPFEGLTVSCPTREHVAISGSFFLSGTIGGINEDTGARMRWSGQLNSWDWQFGVSTRDSQRPTTLRGSVICIGGGE